MKRPIDEVKAKCETPTPGELVWARPDGELAKEKTGSRSGYGKLSCLFFATCAAAAIPVDPIAY